MISEFKYVLDNYFESRSKKLNASDLSYQSVCYNIPNEISKLINNDERYLVEGSVGLGNWASVPWIAIFDRLVTTSAQNGYYPVFLFKEDMSGFYLSLGVGVTNIRLEFKRIKKIEEVLRIQTTNILAKIEHIPDMFSPNTINPIKLRSNNSKNTSLAKYYEDGCVISKYYSATSLPTELELKLDIQNILDVYNDITYNTLSDSVDNVIEQIKDFPKFIGTEKIKEVKQHLRIERNQRLIKEVKKRKGYDCECCGMNFEKQYGEIGKNFIEAHHKQPIHTLTGDVVELDAEKDFYVLCSNCHRMIHKLADPSKIESLKLLINNSK
jgi:5-methylcytosine-specific restriction protein A